jgi:hypothetical protein
MTANVCHVVLLFENIRNPSIKNRDIDQAIPKSVGPAVNNYLLRRGRRRKTFEAA